MTKAEEETILEKVDNQTIAYYVILGEWGEETRKKVLSYDASLFIVIVSSKGKVCFRIVFVGLCAIHSYWLRKAEQSFEILCNRLFI